MKTQILNTNQMIVLRNMRIAEEQTRQMILAEITSGNLSAEDLIRNKHLNHALFGVC